MTKELEMARLVLLALTVHVFSGMVT
ncbi:hypothetical protein DSUL_30067 [Desulfovibrionales bacterium]